MITRKQLATLTAGRKELDKAERKYKSAARADREKRPTRAEGLYDDADQIESRAVARIRKTLVAIIAANL